MTNTGSSAARHFNRNLASLRGIAASIVLVCHALLILRIEGTDNACFLFFDPHNPALCHVQAMLALFNGPACVTLFFVLSGTVLAMSLDRGMSMRWSALPAYWLKRLLRLYPLLMATAVFAALIHFFILSGTHSPALSAWATKEFNLPNSGLPRDVVFNAVGSSSSLNSPAWSIKIEIFISAYFPLLFVLSRLRRGALPVFLLLVALMFAPIQPQSSAYLHIYTASFFLGALIYRGGQPLADWYFQRSAFFRYATFVLVLVAFLVTRRVFSPTAFVTPTAVFIEMFCAGYFVLVGLYAHSRLMSSAPLVWLGEVSYGIYLIHVPVLFSVTVIFLRLGLISPVGNHWFETGGLIGWTFLITVALAWLAYNVIEAPMVAFGHRLARSLSHWVKSHPHPVLSPNPAIEPPVKS
jgi:peptidoglycan/LPS O-acetylase OafA/YrhL